MACMALQLSIFCDFDGTITTVDTGDEFFAEFSTVFDDSMARLMSGKSSVRDYYHDVVRGLRPLSSEMVQDFALRYPIDAYFADFVKYCHELSFPLTIVSDGFKEYIKEYLKFVLPKVQKERVDQFKAGAQAFVKFVLANFKDFVIYTPSDNSSEGALIYERYVN
jgi:2-hydroxy-3-keto-5-methylthiopentenyl-1-phosphate phosphatase